jgi:hypothetical protein
MTFLTTSNTGNMFIKASSGAPQAGTVPGGCAWIHTWRPATQTVEPAARNTSTP